MKITSAKQILENCKWINPNLLVFELYSEMLNKSFQVELDFNSQKEEKEIREETLKSIIEFQNLKAHDLIAIQDAMWKYVQKTNETHKYSIDNGQTWKESRLADNLLHLGIKNKEDAISKSPITGVGFINDDEIDHSYFTIFMSPAWDHEHGLTAYFYHGKLDYVE